MDQLRTVNQNFDAFNVNLTLIIPKESRLGTTGRWQENIKVNYLLHDPLIFMSTSNPIIIFLELVFANLLTQDTYVVIWIDLHGINDVI